MATARIWRKVVGVKVELTNDEVASLSNTMSGLGALIADARAGVRINAKTITEMFDDDAQSHTEYEISAKTIKLISDLHSRSLREEFNEA